MRRSSIMVRSILPILIALLIVCTAIQNMRTSTEVVIEKPPYYRGRLSRLNLEDIHIGHLPIVLDIRTSDNETIDIWQELIDAMNAFIDTEEWTLPLEAIDLPEEKAPDLFFGFADMWGAPVTGLSYTDEENEDKTPPMILYYKNASTDWKENLLASAEKANVDYILFITVGFSEYLVRQTTFLGKKEITLGTGHHIPVKWLTSLDDPVEVLHITGALLDKTGKIHRHGAEGIVAADPASFFESIISLQNTISPEIIEKLTTGVRRDDLPDNPLNYRIALQNLVANLTGQRKLIIE